MRTQKAVRGTLADVDDASDPGLPAGEFSAWLADIRGAISGDRRSDVPCDGCTACCRSSQFVHVAPDEADALAHIPAEVLFPAPGSPPGHVVMGYDEEGHCPMLVDDRCSIYEHRPRTCRAYDCRVFPAAGLDIGDKPLIAERARRWRFGYPDERDRVEHAAVRAAAATLGDDRDRPDIAPITTTQLAVRAIELTARRQSSS